MPRPASATLSAMARGRSPPPAMIPRLFVTVVAAVAIAARRCDTPLGRRKNEGADLHDLRHVRPFRHRLARLVGERSGSLEKDRLEGAAHGMNVGSWNARALHADEVQAAEA